MCIGLIRRGAVHGLRINRKKRNHLSDILWTSFKVGRPVSPLKTNLDKEQSLFLDYSTQHVSAENAVFSVSRSVILLPSYQPGLSSERLSRKVVEHNCLKSHPWSTFQDIQAISNNIARERIRLYEESDPVTNDRRRLLPAEWATEQTQQKHQWELDVFGQCKCGWQHVLSPKGVPDRAPLNRAMRQFCRSCLEFRTVFLSPELIPALKHRPSTVDAQMQAHAVY
jgi:hypothetical protein